MRNKSAIKHSPSVAFRMEVCCPTNVEPSAAIHAHPSDVTSLGLLPGDPLLLSFCGIHLYSGRVWPVRRCTPGFFRVPCLSPVLESLVPGFTIGEGDGSPLEVTRVDAGIIIPPAACELRIVRKRGVAATPSLITLRKSLLGVVLPLGGVTVRFPGLDSSQTSHSIKLLPFVDPSQNIASSHCCLTQETIFLEGLPPRMAPLAGSEEIKHSTPPPTLGGLDLQFSLLFSLARSALSSSSGRNPHPRPAMGVLLCGPPGTGKTHLVRCLCHSLGIQPVVLNGGELICDVVGEAEERLREAWTCASRSGSSGMSGGVLFLDEVESLCPSRDASSSGVGEVEARITAQLASLMDGNHKRDGSGFVFVVGATNRPGSLDSSLRRPGRFDREVLLTVPSVSSRCEILKACLSRFSHALITDVEAEVLAREKMHGFVGADVAAACREASWAALRRFFGEATIASPGADQEIELSHRLSKSLSLNTPSDAHIPPPPQQLTGLSITLEDLVLGTARVQPSSLREMAVEVACTPWSSIAGQEDVKSRLREAVEWPAKYEAAYKTLGIDPPRGILLYGPPGCSKTMMARALATSDSMNFISIKGPELLSKYVGDSEKAVARVYAQARAAAPCVLFFDEFDSLGVRRDSEGEGGGVGVRVVAQLLQEMDSGGTRGGGRVLTVAATNRPDLLDRALLRPGRIDQLLYVGLPDSQARASIASEHFSRIHKVKQGGVSLAEGPTAIVAGCVTPQQVADATEGMSGAEVLGVLREAGSRALAEAMASGDVSLVAEGGSAAVTLQHINAAASSMPRQVTPSMLQFYESWRLENPL